MVLKILAVALGGAIGASTRFMVSEWMQNKLETGFPYSTMLINIVGSFIIGICMAYFLSREDLPAWIKLFVVTGCLGGLTTFSTFSYEWVALLSSREWIEAAFYGGIQIIGGLFFCLLGGFIGRLFF